MPSDPQIATIAASYDDVPFGFRAVPMAHPARLAAVGVRRGVDVIPVANSRVLELGASEGGQLINLASDFPNASFVGVELSAVQVDRARRYADRLGLHNVEMYHQDIADLPDDFGTFDYVLCNGVYSWVPPLVRDAILASVRRHLAPNGLAMVSFNTSPGWDIVGRLRDILIDHVAHLSSLHDRIVAARELLAVMQDEVDPANPHSRLLRRAISDALGNDPYLAHEHLAPVNEPSLLHEFAAHAFSHGLRYLDDLATPGMPTISTADGSPPRGLDDLRPQHRYDLVNGTRFRAAVLCHGEVRVNAHSDPTALRPLHVTAPLVSEAPAQTTDSSTATFAGPTGRRISTTSPTMTGVLLALANRYPSSAPVTDLLGDPSLDAALLRQLDGLAHRGMAWFTTEPIVHVSTVNDRPVVPAVTRLALELGESTANRQYEWVPLDDLVSFVASMLDGDHAVADVVAAVSAAIGEGHLSPTETQGEPVSGPAGLVADALHVLAQDGMLEA